MSWTTIKRDMADILFSKYIRLKAKQCAYCGKRGEGKDGITGLQASHFYGRRKESVRFDEQNVDVLCISCHWKLGTQNRRLYEEWKLAQLGQREYDLLMMRANTPGKRDRKLYEIYYRDLLRKL